MPENSEPGGRSTMPARATATRTEYRALLVRGVNWLGDAVMTTPALQRLRERFPQAHISLLTDEKLAGLWEHYPGVDTLITFNRGDNPLSVARRLRGQAYEAALILPNSPRSALEVWLAGVPCRIGYAVPWRNWFLTHPLEYPGNWGRLRRRRSGEVKRLVRPGGTPRGVSARISYVHQMHDYLGLAAALGSDPAPLPPKLDMSAHEIEAALAACVPDSLGADGAGLAGGSPFIGVNPSAAYGPAKRWPIERFAEVTREVSKRFSTASWLIFGSRSDRDTGERLAALGAGRMINLAGRTSLRQLMALLKTCRVLLTNDSGPMHLAAALGTPVVAVFGSTSPELTAPGMPGDPRHHLLCTGAPCSPCFRRTCPIDFRCMTGITVRQTLLAVLEALA